jgi:hypothetical protein
VYADKKKFFPEDFLLSPLLYRSQSPVAAKGLLNDPLTKEPFNHVSPFISLWSYPAVPTHYS